MCSSADVRAVADAVSSLEIDSYSPTRRTLCAVESCGYNVLSLDVMNLAFLLAIVPAYVSFGHLDAFLDRESQPIDIVAYADIKNECYHFIYSVHRNLHILEWPDHMVKYILKTSLEDYLVGYLNTPESRKLHLKYEAVDWDIQEMMQMHLLVDE